MRKVHGAAGEHFNPRSDNYVPHNISTKPVASALRGVGCYETTTVKDGFWRRQIDKLI
jgi:hypothetical protein